MKLELPPFKSNFLDTASRKSTDLQRGAIVYLMWNGKGYETGTSFFETKTWQFKTDVSPEAMEDAKQLGFDAKTGVESKLIGSAFTAYEDYLYERYKELGLDNRPEPNRWKRFVSEFLWMESYDSYIDPSNPISMGMLVSGVKPGLDPDFMVIGSQFEVCLAVSPHFVPSIHSNDHNYRLAGRLMGVDVFISNAETPTIVFGKRSTGRDNTINFIEDPSAEFFAQDGISGMALWPVRTITLRLSSVFHIVPGAKHRFTVRKAKLGKKPLWRKLLMA
jgi:hypothetical protein